MSSVVPLATTATNLAATAGASSTGRSVLVLLAVSVAIAAFVAASALAGVLKAAIELVFLLFRAVTSAAGLGLLALLIAGLLLFGADRPASGSGDTVPSAGPIPSRVAPTR